MPDKLFHFVQHDIVLKEHFVTESGYTFQALQVRYFQAGQLNEDRSNVVWVSHALTANANPGEWWPDFWTENCPFDPAEQAVICVNLLGSCYGTTGPLTPGTAGPLLHQFPVLTVRDMAHFLDRVADALGIQAIHTLVGPSLGGQVALEWALLSPQRVQRLVALATNAKHSAWGIAFNENQRWAIEQDPTWKTNAPTAGLQGMELARAIALTSYRTYEGYVATQTDDVTIDNLRRASRYQRYQGHKLSQRFNAFSYYRLTQAMDSHDVGRDRGSTEAALQQITIPTLIVTMEGDLLFPPDEQSFLATHIAQADWVTIPTDFGHDGFLLETDLLQQHIQQFLTHKNTAHYVA